MMTSAYARLVHTATFRNDGFARWQRTLLIIIGCGMLGSRLAVEAVRSGVKVRLYDFEPIDPHNNLATSATSPGTSKVGAVVSACEQIRPGSASGHCLDIRHVGVGDLKDGDVLIDCTDDARLGFLLTQISNGLQLPLLRVAVDGSGRWELGRVLCSDIRDGGSCQMCTRSFSDLARGIDRTPCPVTATAERPPTLAGGALSSTMAGLALLQAQRLVTGNDRELVRNREVIVDLNHFQMMSAAVRRSSECISGHEAWEMIDISSDPGSCLEDVFQEAASVLGHDAFSLEPFNHPFCLEARCQCGSRRVEVSTVWARRPTCNTCGQEMIWSTETQIAAINRDQAAQLNVLNRPVTELGLPKSGALFEVRVAQQRPLRLILTNARSSCV